jgi:hypothetical protein
LVVQGYGKLGPDAPFRAESGPERLLDQLDREGVGIALGLADDELARKQLEAFSGLKYPVVDQPVIFDSRPAADAGVCRLHAF